MGGTGIETTYDLPKGYRRRVVVKFTNRIAESFETAFPGVWYIDYESSEQQNALAVILPWWPGLVANNGPLSLVRLFVSVTQNEIENLQSAVTGEHPWYDRNLLTYFAIDCPETVSPEALIEELSSQLAGVEVAYVETLPVQPPALIPSDQTNPDLKAQFFHQVSKVHDAAFPNANHVNGIGSKYAWCFKGGDGSGVSFADIEQGWDGDHEDLRKASFLPGSPGGDRGPWVGLNYKFKGHGTAVLGELFAVSNNGKGGSGVVPGATGLTFSEWLDDKTFNTANALLASVHKLAQGDVIVLESQAEVDHPVLGTRLLPREVEPAVYDVIVQATLANRIVVEAAGNSATDLDDHEFLPHFKVPHWNFPLAEWVQDSGAIMVAACNEEKLTRYPNAPGEPGFSQVAPLRVLRVTQAHRGRAALH